MHSAARRQPGAFQRVGMSVAVPAVAVAAHGIGGGGVPGATGILVSAAIGVVLSLVPDPRRRTRTQAIATTTLLLTVAQVACHWALMLGDTGHAAHAAHALHTAGLMPMLLTHAVAIPVSAIALVLATTLADVLTSTLRALRPPPRLRSLSPPRFGWEAPPLAAGPVLGGPGVRGPPVAA